MPTTLAITGPTGRMGRRLVALAADHGLTLSAALARPDSPSLNQDAGTLAGIPPLSVPLTPDLPSAAARGLAAPQVLIDFTTPQSFRHWLHVCRTQNIPLVIGTTGLTPADHALIDDAAKTIPVLQSPNMSLGVNLLFQIAAHVAKTLGPDYDIEIAEAHHRFKKDAPSGTALGLADAILHATGKTRDRLVYSRHDHEEPRQRGDIGMSSLRMGDEVGLHTAYFAALGERLELTHRATTRDTFAHGALRAAQWLAPQPPGRYSMPDVLGLK